MRGIPIDDLSIDVLSGQNRLENCIQLLDLFDTENGKIARGRTFIGVGFHSAYAFEMLLVR